jgi:hypothetical protein
MKSILDPSFRYTASFNTDLRRTFARFRRDDQRRADAARRSAADGLATVTSIGQRAGSVR